MKHNDTDDDAIREGEPPYFGNTNSAEETSPIVAGTVRAAPVWNTISLGAPCLGFVCGVVAGLCAPHMEWVVWGFRVWFGFASFGFLAALCSLVRVERWWGLTMAGFLLNLPVLIFTWDLAIHGR